MTKQEAVKILEEIKPFCNSRQIEAVNMAIKVLSKESSDSGEKSE